MNHKWYPKNINFKWKRKLQRQVTWFKGHQIRHELNVTFWFGTIFQQCENYDMKSVGMHKKNQIKNKNSGRKKKSNVIICMPLWKETTHINQLLFLPGKIILSVLKDSNLSAITVLTASYSFWLNTWHACPQTSLPLFSSTWTVAL